MSSRSNSTTRFDARRQSKRATSRGPALNAGAGETLALYTDGFTEAFAPDKTMFGVERLTEVLSKATASPLSVCAEQARVAVERFTGQTELQDDQSLLLLRRHEFETA